MVLLLVFMQLTRDLFAIAKFLFLSPLVGEAGGYKLVVSSSVRTSVCMHDGEISRSVVLLKQQMLPTITEQ